MSGNCFPSRPKILLIVLIKTILDTQGQVGSPSGALLHQRAFTHLMFFFLDVTKLDLNAQ